MVLFSGEPSSKDFDITLMICLLRNLIPIDIIDGLPSATDTSLRADLSRIKFYRNFIVHCDSALVADTEFESYWKDVTPVIHNYFYTSTRREGAILQSPLVHPSVHTFVKDVSAATGRNDFIFDT
jgi:hypothetical protein